MTDDTQNADVDTEDSTPVPSELDSLKARASLMGITHHPSIGVEKLKEKINNALEDTPPPIVDALPKNTSDYISHSMFTRMSLKDRKRKAGSLIRINVMCMNPNKKGWEGEIISVGSAKLGTYKKYVLFGTEDGWHVPYIIYEVLKDRKCSLFITVKDHLGKQVRKAKSINEFNIEVLPPLTKDELKALAQRQAMAGSLLDN